MKEKVVIVTGSTSGIGRETAVLLASKGANVVVVGRRQRLIEEVMKRCDEVSPFECTAFGVNTDVTKDDDLKRLVEKTVEKFGKIDVLINNAGAAAQTSIMDKEFMKKYDSMMNLNLRSAVSLSHFAVPHLEKTKGCIVNVSSLASIKPSERVSAYCMAKTALDMFTNCLALELGPKGIRVNGVNPGFVRTNFFRASGLEESMVSEVEKHYRNISPIHRVGEPMDIAKAIEYLVSEAASFVTGSNLVIDGGVRFGS